MIIMSCTWESCSLLLGQTLLNPLLQPSRNPLQPYPSVLLFILLAPSEELNSLMAQATNKFLSLLVLHLGQSSLWQNRLLWLLVTVCRGWLILSRMSSSLPSVLLSATVARRFRFILNFSNPERSAFISRQNTGNHRLIRHPQELPASCGITSCCESCIAATCFLTSPTCCPATAQDIYSSVQLPPPLLLMELVKVQVCHFQNDQLKGAGHWRCWAEGCYCGARQNLTRHLFSSSSSSLTYPMMAVLNFWMWHISDL